MGKPEFIARQSRKPTGLLGHIVAWVMARETKPENDRTLELLELHEHDHVLEVGFGHGETLYRAAQKVSRGQLAGVDFSDVMISRASSRNRELLRSGRLDLRQGESHELPFERESFNKVFTVHTIYFWADPAEDLEEIFRVLKPGGRLVISYRSSEDKPVVQDLPDSVYRVPGAEEVETILSRCEFQNVTTITERIGQRLTNWTIAEKPGIHNCAKDANGCSQAFSNTI
ncbi:MAG: methyltransferase domain-containing protein [Pseudomonadota bacterium]